MLTVLTHIGHHAIYLSGAYTMGANVIKAPYTKAGDLNGAAEHWRQAIQPRL